MPQLGTAILLALLCSGCRHAASPGHANDRALLELALRGSTQASSFRPASPAADGDIAFAVAAGTAPEPVWHTVRVRWKGGDFEPGTTFRVRATEPGSRVPSSRLLRAELLGEDGRELQVLTSLRLATDFTKEGLGTMAFGLRTWSDEGSGGKGPPLLPEFMGVFLSLAAAAEQPEGIQELVEGVVDPPSLWTIVTSGGECRIAPSVRPTGIDPALRHALEFISLHVSMGDTSMAHGVITSLRNPIAEDVLGGVLCIALQHPHHPERTLVFTRQ